MREYVKIKVKSLAEEAKMIRREENLLKWKKRAARGRERAQKAIQGLQLHRVREVRREARSANLAYGFMLGLEYDQMENFAWSQPDWNKIQRLIENYGEGGHNELLDKFQSWKEKALRGVKPFETTRDNRDGRHPRSSKGQLNEWTQVRMQALAEIVMERSAGAP